MAESGGQTKDKYLYGGADPLAEGEPGRNMFSLARLYYWGDRVDASIYRLIEKQYMLCVFSYWGIWGES